MAISDFDEKYGVQITVKTFPETCADCPLWCEDWMDTETGNCLITDKRIEKDGLQYEKRMDDCQLIVRPDQKQLRNLTTEETEKMLQRMKAETLRSIRRTDIQQTRSSLYCSFLGAVDMAENMNLITRERKKQLYRELEQEANRNR